MTYHARIHHARKAAQRQADALGINHFVVKEDRHRKYEVIAVDEYAGLADYIVHVAQADLSLTSSDRIRPRLQHLP